MFDVIRSDIARSPEVVIAIEGYSHGHTFLCGSSDGSYSIILRK